MKVLMFSTDATILESGSESYSRMKDYGTLAERLDIVVCTTGAQKQELKISETACAIPTNSRSKFWYMRDMLRVVRRSVTGGVDVVTSQDPFETGLAGWLAARRLKAKLQLQVHTDFLSPYFSRESLKNRIRVILAKWLLPKADGIRVVSERIKNSLLDLGLPESKIVVLPVFVDVKRIEVEPTTTDLHEKYPQFDFIFLMTSRLEPEKNIYMALDAMKEVVKKYPKTGLVIVGEGSLKRKLEKRVRENRLDHNVIFEDWMKYITSYYKTSDVFLATSNYEGYGRSVVMSGASATAIVSTDVGLIGGVIGSDDCLVVSVGDIQGLISSMLALREDERFRQELGQKARAAVQALGTRDAYLERYKQLWEACV